MNESRYRTYRITVLTLIIGMLAVGVRAEQGTAGNDAGVGYAQRQELLNKLVEKKDAPTACYALLKRRLLEGHFDAVKAGLDLRDDAGRRLFEGYRFAQLRALCTRAIFRRYSFLIGSQGRPNEEQGAELRRLAQEVTGAYEEALKLAPSDFERARVYARWHEIHTRSRFEADSRLLRSASPLAYEDKPVDPVLSSQAARLRSTAMEALGFATVYGEPVKVDAQENFLDVLTDEFYKLGRIGVPESVFAEMLKDLPGFVQHATHPVVLTQARTYHMTIRYYLWYALTGPRPDEIDKEFISLQTRAVSRHMRRRLTDQLSATDAETASSAFLDRVEFVRDNCFLPRFKRSLWPFEWSEPRYKGEKSMEEEVHEIIDQALKSTRDNLDRLMSRPRVFGNAQAATQQEIDSQMGSLASGIMRELSRYQQASYLRPPPGVTIIDQGGTTHRQSGIWVYTIGKARPVPAYPWNKSITSMDSSRTSTRKIARRVLKAMAEADTNALNTLVSESREFSKHDLHSVVGKVTQEHYAAQPEQMLEIERVFIEKPWSWSAVRMRPPSGEAQEALALVFQAKHAVGYWLAWAGLVERPEKETLADLLARLKPDLKRPPTPEPVEIAKPVDIPSVDNVSALASLQSVQAGHGWRVRLALTEGEAQTPWKVLYCQTEYTGQDHPPRPIPFRRYVARYLGPVVWTISPEGFRATAPKRSGRPAPPMSLKAKTAVYAATLPLHGFEQAYVQVYSAFDGRELARAQIVPDRSQPWYWGRFMAHQPEAPFGVSADFLAAYPGTPAFKPMPTQATDAATPLIKLSIKDGLFALSTDQRILPTRGSRLLARWWLNDEPVSPERGGEWSVVRRTTAAAQVGGGITGVAAAKHPGPEGLAGLLRLPLALPAAVLNAAKPGDKVGLQVMLSPDRIESPWLNPEESQCVASVDVGDIPLVPILSGRLDFKVKAGMIAQRRSKTVNPASLNALVEAIGKGNTRRVHKLVSACPPLAHARGPSGYSMLGTICGYRPQPRRLWRWRIGGKVNRAHWQEMAEIAGILIDYGADVNAEIRGSESALYHLIDETRSPQPDDAPPLALVRALLQRGANPELGGHDGTALQKAVQALRSGRANTMVPVIKLLLEYGADVFAVGEPWGREPVYRSLDDLTNKGHDEVAALIRKHGAKRDKALKPAVRAGVDELLGRIRNADEKALLSLNRELPVGIGIDWLRTSRRLQEEYGPDLRAIGSIAQLRLRGDWAEVHLPTGGKGDMSNLYIILLRYPGGAYHAVQAGWTDGQYMGGRIRDASKIYKELTNTVYSAFAWYHRCENSGGIITSYPRNMPLVSIGSERDRLAIRGRNMPSWSHFYAELGPELIEYWNGTWSLEFLSNATFATGDRKMVMADGRLSIQNKDKALVFVTTDGQVKMKEDGIESFSEEFILDLQTLEVKPGVEAD